MTHRCRNLRETIYVKLANAYFLNMLFHNWKVSGGRIMWME